MTQLAVVNENALAALEQFGSSGNTDHVAFLRFSKGDFVAGIEESQIEDDEEFAANIPTLSHGYICWKDGSPVDEQMATVISGHTIAKGSLADHGPYEGSDGWREQSSIEFVHMETGERFRFATSSRGGVKALSVLAKEYATHVKSGGVGVVPVVRMVPDSYKHDKYGRVHVPTFPIVRWVGPDLSDIVEEVDDSDIPFEEEAAPKKRGRRAVRA